MDGGVWWGTWAHKEADRLTEESGGVLGLTKSQIGLSDFHF